MASGAPPGDARGPRTWPALEVRHLSSISDLIQAALLDFDVAAVEEDSADLWRIFFQDETQRERAAGALREQFPQLDIRGLDVRDEDWAARSQAGVRAIAVGRLVVAPPWDRPADGSAVSLSAGREPATGSSLISRCLPRLALGRLAASAWRAPRAWDRYADAQRVRDPRLGPHSGPIVIVIQPSMGFGTGHHATTRLCLRALQDVDLRGRRVIDVGTGSGVLAIAASRLGAADVVAVDDDPDAIQSARENVLLNEGVQVSVHVGDVRARAFGGRIPRTPDTPDEGARHTTGGRATEERRSDATGDRTRGTSEHGSFDVVVANLTGGLLVSASDDLQRLTARSGRLLLSGLLVDEEPSVVRAFADWTAERRLVEDGWACIVLTRRR